MNDTAPRRWLTLPSPFETETGTLYLLDAPETGVGRIRAELLDESYARPFVVDDGQLRYLYFNVRLMQSAMRLAAPDALELRYTQVMASFLLFRPTPARIALIGLGGGSLLKFLHRQLPSTHSTAIEIDPDVIALGELFRLPPNGPQLQVVERDGAQWLREPAEEHGGPLDVLLVDAFDPLGFAPELANREFLENAAARLSEQGVLVVNLAGEADRYAGLVADALAVFDEQVIVVPVPEDGNHVLFAFRARYFEPRWRWLHNHAKELRARHGLDFPELARELERAWRQSLARDVASTRQPRRRR